jgi:hypothetical protein
MLAAHWVSSLFERSMLGWGRDAPHHVRADLLAKELIVDDHVDCVVCGLCREVVECVEGVGGIVT